MSLQNKLGAGYSGIKDKVKIKTIHLNINDAEFDLKVKIPLKSEMEALNERIIKVDDNKVEALFKKLSDSIVENIKEGGEEFLNALNKEKEYIVIKDDDVILDGNSIRNISRLTIMWEAKVENYFQLLVSETDIPITESFEQISEEFPDEVIKQIVEEIEKAIKPTYDSVKKN